MLSRQQELRTYCLTIYTVGSSCKRRREKKIKMFCIALMVTFDLFKLTYRMTWVKKRRQTTRQLWHFTDENQGAKKFEKRNLAHFHTWAWFHIFVYFSNKFLKKNDNINFKNIPRTIQDDLKIIIIMSNQIANQKGFIFLFSYNQNVGIIFKTAITAKRS